MNKKQWVVIYTPVGKDNIVCGPFDNGLDAIALISEDFNYTSTAVYDNITEALADNSKLAFEPINGSEDDCSEWKNFDNHIKQK
jgi:hypothetical protein